MSPRGKQSPDVHREGGALFQGSSRCKPLAPGRLEAWKQVHAAGKSGDVCDEIVRNRPVPLYLLAVLDWPRRPKIVLDESSDPELAAERDRAREYNRRSAKRSRAQAAA